MSIEPKGHGAEAINDVVSILGSENYYVSKAFDTPITLRRAIKVTVDFFIIENDGKIHTNSLAVDQ